MLAAAEQIARTLLFAGAMVYLWDLRRRGLAAETDRARQAREQRVVIACAVAALRLLRRAEARHERGVRAAEMTATAGALTASLETRRWRAPRERPARRVGFAP